jgi:CheY-like chemotaxis protein
MNSNMPGLGAALGSVLVLDDEGIVLMMLEDMLRDLGAAQVHSFTDPSKALAVAAAAPIDCAILDVMMRGSPSYEVAEVLRARGVPFVFSSGVSADQLDARFRDVVFLNKPFSDAELVASLSKAMGLTAA